MHTPRGFQPTFENYEGHQTDKPSPIYDGTFYQPTQDVESRRSAVLPFINHEIPSGLLSIDTYQDWVELDWKVPHGSWEAVERFGDKLVNEELAVEILEELKGTSPKKLADEIGDFKWLITALASNSGVSLSRAVAEQMHSKNLVPRNDVDLKFVDIDYIIASGFDPLAIPGLDDWDDDEIIQDRYNVFLELGVGATAIRGAAEKQYGYNENIVLGGWMEKVAEIELKPMIGRMVISLGFIAHNWANTSLSDIALNNIIKVSRRADANLIDKTDGDRSVIEP